MQKFKDFPYTPDSNPTHDYHVVNKKYVDSLSSAFSASLGALSTSLSDVYGSVGAIIAGAYSVENPLRIKGNVSADSESTSLKINFESTYFSLALDAGSNSLSINIAQSGIDHDAITNFVAAEHVDHTAISAAVGSIGLTVIDITTSINNISQSVHDLSTSIHDLSQSVNYVCTWVGSVSSSLYASTSTLWEGLASTSTTVRASASTFTSMTASTLWEGIGSTSTTVRASASTFTSMTASTLWEGIASTSTLVRNSASALVSASVETVRASLDSAYTDLTTSVSGATSTAAEYGVSVFGSASNAVSMTASTLWESLGNLTSRVTDISQSVTAIWASVSTVNEAGGGGGVEAIDDLNDVDTTSDAPVKNEVLKWNGSNWVPATYDTTFTFSIASFSDGETTTQEIGSGEWKATGSVSFTATYNNGPPTTASIMISLSTATQTSIGAMDGAAYTTGYSNEAINYPTVKDQLIKFMLYATDGEDTDTEYETAIYFRNYRFWGTLDHNTGITEADIEGLSSELSNSTTYSKTINSSAGQYVVIAYPSSYSAMEGGDDYEDDGNCDFLFNSIVCAFKEADTVAVTNAEGYTENYQVYAAENANLGNYTLSATPTTTMVNYLYYGKTTDASSFDEADVEGLTNKTATNDNTQTWTAVDTGVGEYMLFAFPKRLGTVTFWVGGFEGGFEDPETVAVTNANGYTEDYYVWRSTNSNIGSTVVATT